MPRRKYATPPLCAPYEGHDPRSCDACDWIERGIEITEEKYLKKIELIRQNCWDPRTIEVIKQVLEED